MKVLANGYFSEVLTGEDLAKGLRPSSRSLINSSFFSASSGAIGMDGMIVSIPALSLDTLMSDPLIVEDDFPFPQVFQFDKHTIVCNRTTVLELKKDGSLELKYTAATGNLWTGIAQKEFIYMSNGVVSIIRNPQSQQFEVSSAPICEAICNYNGQIICGNIQ